jgi:agmatine/peptidylarginine deiminase
METELKSFTQKDGSPYNLVALPMADACFDDEGQRLPATYANFLIINDAVLVPTYGVSQDDAALQILQTCFPDREIIGINCRTLIEQHGSLHCVTMQFPKEVELNVL